MIRGIIAILKGMQTPAATAAGVACGAMLGLLPKDNMMSLVFFVIFFLTTVDKPAAIAASVFFTPVGPALDGLAHKIGMALLTQTPALTGAWTSLYNMPLVPWTKFNNTAVLGQLVIGAVLWLPLFFISKTFMTYYQKKLKPKVEKWKVVQAVKAFRIYQWWDSIRQA